FCSPPRVDWPLWPGGMLGEGRTHVKDGGMLSGATYAAVAAPGMQASRFHIWPGRPLYQQAVPCCRAGQLRLGCRSVAWWGRGSGGGGGWGRGGIEGRGGKGWGAVIIGAKGGGEQTPRKAGWGGGHFPNRPLSTPTSPFLKKNPPPLFGVTML